MSEQTKEPTELIQLTLTPNEARMLAEHFAASCLAMRPYVDGDPQPWREAAEVTEMLMARESGRPGNNETGHAVTKKIAGIMDWLEERGMGIQGVTNDYQRRAMDV